MDMDEQLLDIDGEKLEVKIEDESDTNFETDASNSHSEVLKTGPENMDCDNSECSDTSEYFDDISNEYMDTKSDEANPLFKAIKTERFDPENETTETGAATNLYEHEKNDKQNFTDICFDKLSTIDSLKYEPTEDISTNIRNISDAETQNPVDGTINETVAGTLKKPGIVIKKTKQGIKIQKGQGVVLYKYKKKNQGIKIEKGEGVVLDKYTEVQRNGRNQSPVAKSNIKTRPNIVNFTFSLNGDLLTKEKCTALDIKSSTAETDRFQCKECGKSYRYPTTLKRHQESHSVEIKTCDECGKCFTDMETLKQHKLNHLCIKKTFKCSECGKSFSLKSTLKTHKLTHSNERPFICFKCGARFCQRIALNTHSLIHSGEKPYKCLECGKCFRQTAALKEHELIHSNEKPLECSECGKFFRHASGLAQHKQIHSNRKCNDCGKWFAKTAYLDKHMRAEHPKKTTDDL